MDHKIEQRPEDLFGGQSAWATGLWAAGALALVAGIAVYAGMQG